MARAPMKASYSVRATLSVLSILAGCSTDDPPPPPLYCHPDLECQSLVESGGFVSGIASLDAFFHAALRLRGQASVLEADVTNVLAEMAAILGLDGSGSAADIAARIEAHLESRFDGKLEGALTVVFQEPRCDVSGRALVQAAARCDAGFEPARASVECGGGCVIDGAARAECSGELRCIGPSQKCKGSCEGACELVSGAECMGVCSGICELDGTIACDGECTGERDADGNCTGECQLSPGAKCEGECKGSCELSAGASCEGLCHGECTYDPGAGSCDGELVCLPAAGAFVECNGTCTGDVRPPSVVAECEASAKADARFDATCAAPSVDVDYRLDPVWAAEADAPVKLAFEAQLHAFVQAFARLQARGAKLKLVGSAAADLLASGDGAVKGALWQIADGDDESYVRLGAVCAAAALPETKALLTSAAERVLAAFEAVRVVTTAVVAGEHEARESGGVYVPERTNASLCFTTGNACSRARSSFGSGAPTGLQSP